MATTQRRTITSAHIDVLATDERFERDASGLMPVLKPSTTVSLEHAALNGKFLELLHATHVVEYAVIFPTDQINLLRNKTKQKQK